MRKADLLMIESTRTTRVCLASVAGSPSRNNVFTADSAVRDLSAFSFEFNEAYCGTLGGLNVNIVLTYSSLPLKGLRAETSSRQKSAGGMTFGQYGGRCQYVLAGPKFTVGAGFLLRIFPLKTCQSFFEDGTSEFPSLDLYRVNPFLSLMTQHPFHCDPKRSEQ